MATSYAEVLLTDEIRQEAFARAQSLPIFEGSHRKLEANVVGCIGEVVFERFLEKHGVTYVDHRESTSRDYEVNGQLSLEVKTKDRTVRPRIDYDNSVPAYNHEHQRPDYYYFVSLLRDSAGLGSDVRRFTHAFILGGIDLETLDREGARWETGQVDPSNGTRFWTACINVSMEKLISNKEMIAVFRGAGVP